MSQLNWNKILGWDEEQVEDFRLTAFLYIREGKYDIAKTFCETLAVLNPDNSYDLATLGALYLQLNNPVNALTYLDKAKSLNPKSQTIQINRIKAMLQLGYREEGLRLLKSFIPTCKDKFIVSDAQALQMAYNM